ncbi:MAG TPA: porin family protein [Lentimicrobium sp.]|nr:porin family protein [Lentimicrobium sp.]
MKTKVFLILSILFLSTGLFAQNETEDNREKLQFGIRAGVSYANVYDEKGEDFVADGKLGAAGGIVLSIPIGRYLGFQPEAMFIQKGFSGDARYNGKPYSLTRTTNHLDFPLQLKFNPAKNFSLLGGPQYSFLLSRKDDIDVGNLTIEEEDIIKNDKIEENIFGLIFGAEFNFNAVTITGKAGWDLQQNDDNAASFSPRYKNQWLLFTLGLNF